MTHKVAFLPVIRFEVDDYTDELKAELTEKLGCAIRESVDNDSFPRIDEIHIDEVYVFDENGHDVN